MSDSTQQQVDEFADQATERYDAFIHWMINNWPQPSDPLSIDDFTAGKREMGLLLGAKLHANSDHGRLPDIGASKDEGQSDQYLPVTPAPWP